MTDKDTFQMIRKDITERLRDRDNHDCIEAANEIEHLRKERDEARREVCHLMRSDDYYEPFDGTVFEYAKSRGWDCFGDYEKSNEALDKLSELDQELGLQ
jgi:hypothetical protein